MTQRFGADGFWERLKKKSLRLQAADRTDDNTHDGHGFVMVLGGGGASVALLTCLQFVLESYAVAPAWTWDDKLWPGMAVVNLMYLGDELDTRRELGFRYKPWDGFGDFYKGACLWVPVALESTVVLYAMAAVLACWYYLLRPV